MDEDPPRYLEAYPALNMTELSGKRWRGTWHIEWHNEFGDWIGSGAFVWRDQSAELYYEFSGTQFEPQVDSRTRLTIEPKYYGTNMVRPGVICRGCGAHVNRLFFKLGDWMCSTCQGLRNRSTFLTTVERHTLELNSLNGEIGDGKPDGMTNRQYFKARDRIRDLENKLDDRRAKTPKKFWHTVLAIYRYHSIEEPTDAFRNLPERRRAAILREEQTRLSRGFSAPQRR